MRRLTYPETRLTAERSDRSLRSISEDPANHIPTLVVHTSGEFYYYLSLILKRKWLILSIVAVVTTIAALYAFRLPSIYEATATLRLEPREYTFMEDPRGPVFRGFDAYQYSNTQVMLLSNPQLLRKVILQLNLQSDPGFWGNSSSGKILSSIRGIFSRAKPQNVATEPGSLLNEENPDVESLTPEHMARMEPYVNALLANLKVEPQENTSLITIRFTHTNPETAFRILDTLSKAFVESDSRYEAAGSEAAFEKIAKQVADTQGTLKRLEDERLAYLKTHNLPLGQGQGRNLTAERLGTLSAQLLAAENERKNLQALYESAISAKDIWSIPQVRDSKDIQEMRKTIRDLEQKRAALLEVYTPNWPQIKQIDSELKQLNENIKGGANEALTALKSNYEVAVARESKLRKAYYREQSAANHQSQDEIELARLNQQIDTSKQMYTTLFQRQKELEVNALDRSSRVSITTPPALPLAALGPQRLSKVVMALIISLLAGVGLALLMNQLDNRLKSAEDVANYTYLATLALIPGFRSDRISLGIKGLLGNAETDNKVTELTREVRSPLSEAYRQLRTSLLFNPGRAPKSILVTSGRPLEGKTTTAVGMAITFAQTGAEVLLIDCDLRRPKIQSYLGLPVGKGLTDCIYGQADLETVLYPHAEQPNLKVMTAGPAPPNPADLLGSNEMRRLVESLRERFEYVIVDSPPTNSFADAAILSTLVDGVIIVVHGQRTSRVVVKRVRDRLSEVGANIYGVVLNHASHEADDYYSGYYSGYYAEDSGE